jgi:hypothetical protein
VLELRRVLEGEGVTEPFWCEVPKSRKAPAQVRRALDEGAELVFAWGGDGMVQRCVDVIAGSDVGVRFQYVQTGFIRCNVFFANGANQSDVNSVPPRFTIGKDGNIEADPRFVDPVARDFHLQRGSPAIDAGCHGDTFEPDGTPHDIGAYGGPLAAWVDL